MTVRDTLRSFLQLGGTRKTMAFGVKTIEITAEMIDSMELSPLSDELKEVIRESGVPSLQPLLGPDWEEYMRDLQREYWL